MPPDWPATVPVRSWTSPTPSSIASHVAAELRDDLVQTGAVDLHVGRLAELAGEDDLIRDDQGQQLE